MVEKKIKQKLGGVRVVPKKRQLPYVMRKEYKGHPFLFFRDRGCIISKNLRKDYVMENGKEMVVQDFDFDEVIEHFKKEGYDIIDIDDKKNTKIVEEAVSKYHKEVYDKEANSKVKSE